MSENLNMQKNGRAAGLIASSKKCVMDEIKL
jgi:hypothetical protein